jgi:hypothetical protein
MVQWCKTQAKPHVSFHARIMHHHVAAGRHAHGEASRYERNGGAKGKNHRTACAHGQEKLTGNRRLTFSFLTYSTGALTIGLREPRQSVSLDRDHI